MVVLRLVGHDRGKTFECEMEVCGVFLFDLFQCNRNYRMFGRGFISFYAAGDRDYYTRRSKSPSCVTVAMGIPLNLATALRATGRLSNSYGYDDRLRLNLVCVIVFL